MAERERVQCCIVGGGPAGIMAGALLARAGVRVLVLEKHGDFLRDFRGDTVHPSTLEVLGELGGSTPSCSDRTRSSTAYGSTSATRSLRLPTSPTLPPAASTSL